METGGEVIGAALGNVAQQRRAVQGHQAGDSLIQRAVAAHGYHRVKILAGGRGGCGIPGGGGIMDGQQVAGLGEDGCRVEQRAPGLVAARCGVDDHQKLFLLHGICLLHLKHGC